MLLQIETIQDGMNFHLLKYNKSVNYLCYLYLK